MSDWAFIALAGALGLCAGSFANVCALRWPARESVLTPGSRCPACRAGLRWRDKIPIAGYVALRGRCRHCGARQSPQYVFAELAAGLAWAALAHHGGPTPETLRGALFLAILLGIALADARTYLIPDQFSLGGAMVGLALAPMPGGPSFADAAAGATLGFVFTWTVAALGKAAFGKPAMGGGDVKTMALAGAFLGPTGAVVALFAGALAGAVVFGPVSLKSGRPVPFGVFLATGAAFAYVWGEAVSRWYLGLVLGTG